MSTMIATGYDVRQHALDRTNRDSQFVISGRFKCQRCERNATRTKRIPIGMIVLLSADLHGEYAAFMHILNSNAPTCDCDVARCRIGAAYMRQHRLVLKGARR